MPGVGAVLDKLLRLQIDIVEIGVVSRQGLGDVGVHDAGAAGFFVCLSGGGVFMLYAHHVRHILADAERTQPPGGVNELELCGLELPRVPGGVRHILKEDVRLVHGQGHAVVLDKMLRRHRVKDLSVRQAHHALGFFLVGVLGEGLVAGKIYACFGILGKAQARDVVQKRGDGLLELADLCRLLQILAVLLLFITDDKGAQQAGAQHIGDGIKRQVRVKELQGEKRRHDEAEEHKRPELFALSRFPPQEGSQGIARNQDQQQDLSNEDAIAQGQGAVYAVFVHGKQDGRKEVHAGKQRDRDRKHAPGGKQKAPEAVFLFQVQDNILCPAQDARRHGDKVHRRIGKQEPGKLAAFEHAPEDVRYVIGQHGQQEALVSPPGRGGKRPAAPEKDIAVFNEQDHDRQKADRRVIHLFCPLSSQVIRGTGMPCIFDKCLYFPCYQF